MRQLQRNVDGTIAQQDAGKRDEPIISILGCGLLKCGAKSTDANYWNPAYNAEYIKPNQSSYDKSVAQSNAGLTPKQIEERNNRAGAPLAKAGAVILGGHILAPTAAAIGTELIAFTRNPVLYCTANPTACIGAVDVAAGTAAGVPLTGVPVPHAVPNTTPISVTSTNTIAASEIRFSQNSISFGKIESTTKQAYTYDDLVASMRTNGWKGDPVDVVRMPDGRLTSIDNTRIMAAREAGIDAQVNVRSFDAPLTADEIGRFTKGGQVPSTWGDAVMIRINSQSGRFGVKYPYGADQLPRLTGGSK